MQRPAQDSGRDFSEIPGFFENTNCSLLSAPCSAPPASSCCPAHEGLHHGDRHSKVQEQAADILEELVILKSMTSLIPEEKAQKALAEKN